MAIPKPSGARHYSALSTLPEEHATPAIAVATPLQNRVVERPPAAAGPLVAAPVAPVSTRGTDGAAAPRFSAAELLAARRAKASGAAPAAPAPAAAAAFPAATHRSELGKRAAASPAAPAARPLPSTALSALLRGLGAGASGGGGAEVVGGAEVAGGDSSSDDESAGGGGEPDPFRLEQASAANAALVASMSAADAKEALDEITALLSAETLAALRARHAPTATAPAAETGGVGPGAPAVAAPSTAVARAAAESTMPDLSRITSEEQLFETAARYLPPAERAKLAWTGRFDARGRVIAPGDGGGDGDDGHDAVVQMGVGTAAVGSAFVAASQQFVAREAGLDAEEAAALGAPGSDGSGMLERWLASVGADIANVWAAGATSGVADLKAAVSAVRAMQAAPDTAGAAAMVTQLMGAAAAATAAPGDDGDGALAPLLVPRFDFAGRIVGASVGGRARVDEGGDSTIAAGLHHHGVDQAAAGYTLEECSGLTRSSVPSQRATAWSLLAAVLTRRRAAFVVPTPSTEPGGPWTLHDDAMEAAVYRNVTLPPALPVLLRCGIDDEQAAVLLPALHALAAFIGAPPSIRPGHAAVDDAIVRDNDVWVAAGVLTAAAAGADDAASVLQLLLPHAGAPQSGGCPAIAAAPLVTPQPPPIAYLASTVHESAGITDWACAEAGAGGAIATSDAAVSGSALALRSAADVVADARDGMRDPVGVLVYRMGLLDRLAAILQLHAAPSLRHDALAAAYDEREPPPPSRLRSLLGAVSLVAIVTRLFTACARREAAIASHIALQVALIPSPTSPRSSLLSWLFVVLVESLPRGWRPADGGSTAALQLAVWRAHVAAAMDCLRLLRAAAAASRTVAEALAGVSPGAMAVGPSLNLRIRLETVTSLLTLPADATAALGLPPLSPSEAPVATMSPLTDVGAACVTLAWEAMWIHRLLLAYGLAVAETSLAWPFLRQMVSGGDQPTSTSPTPAAAAARLLAAQAWCLVGALADVAVCEMGGGNGVAVRSYGRARDTRGRSAVPRPAPAAVSAASNLAGVGAATDEVREEAGDGGFAAYERLVRELDAPPDGAAGGTAGRATMLEAELYDSSDELGDGDDAPAAALTRDAAGWASTAARKLKAATATAAAAAEATADDAAARGALALAQQVGGMCDECHVSQRLAKAVQRMQELAMRAPAPPSAALTDWAVATLTATVPQLHLVTSLLREPPVIAHPSSTTAAATTSAAIPSAPRPSWVFPLIRGRGAAALPLVTLAPAPHTLLVDATLGPAVAAALFQAVLLPLLSEGLVCSFLCQSLMQAPSHMVTLPALAAANLLAAALHAAAVLCRRWPGVLASAFAAARALAVTGDAPATETTWLRGLTSVAAALASHAAASSGGLPVASSIGATAVMVTAATQPSRLAAPDEAALRRRGGIAQWDAQTCLPPPCQPIVGRGLSASLAAAFAALTSLAPPPSPAVDVAMAVNRDAPPVERLFHTVCDALAAAVPAVASGPMEVASAMWLCRLALMRSGGDAAAASVAVAAVWSPSRLARLRRRMAAWRAFAVVSDEECAWLSEAGSGSAGALRCHDLAAVSSLAPPTHASRDEVADGEGGRDDTPPVLRLRGADGAGGPVSPLWPLAALQAVLARAGAYRELVARPAAPGADTDATGVRGSRLVALMRLCRSSVAGLATPGARDARLHRANRALLLCQAYLQLLHVGLVRCDSDDEAPATALLAATLDDVAGALLAVQQAETGSEAAGADAAPSTAASTATASATIVRSPAALVASLPRVGAGLLAALGEALVAAVWRDMMPAPLALTCLLALLQQPLGVCWAEAGAAAVSPLPPTVALSGEVSDGDDSAVWRAVDSLALVRRRIWAAIAEAAAMATDGPTALVGPHIAAWALGAAASERSESAAAAAESALLSARGDGGAESTPASDMMGGGLVPVSLPQLAITTVAGQARRGGAFASSELARRLAEGGCPPALAAAVMARVGDGR